MKTLTQKFTFKVPKDHAEAGTEKAGNFTYEELDTVEEAQAYVADDKRKDKGWDFLSLVNEAIKANARSNAYQAAIAPYKPSTVSAEDIQERMVRDFIRLGINEETARKQVAALLATVSE